jgi:hypothetical protein
MPLFYRDGTFRFYNVFTVATKSGQVALHHWDRQLEVDLRAVCLTAGHDMAAGHGCWPRHGCWPWLLATT